MSGTTLLSRTQGETETKIVIPVRYAGYIQFLLATWVAVWLVVEVSLAWSLISKTPNPSQSASITGLLLAFFTVGGIFMMWRLLWVSRGKEILEVTSTRLVVRRQPAGGEAETFDRSRIHDLRVGSYARKLIYPSWGRQFLGKESNFIAFDYGGKPQEIARGINRRDANNLVSLLHQAS